MLQSSLLVSLLAVKWLFLAGLLTALLDDVWLSTTICVVRRARGTMCLKVWKIAIEHVSGQMIQVSEVSAWLVVSETGQDQLLYETSM